ncbi:MAG: hypothetical protein ACFB9N_05680 [Geitlerinemataceae cyanobacterium]
MALLDRDTNYTFSSFFQLPYDVDEVLAEFGYSYAQQRLTLPRNSTGTTEAATLRSQIEANLPYAQLSSEAAKREVLVAPVLLLVARLCQQTLRFEYPVKVNNWLQGSLDYLLRSQSQVVVVEAKRDDLTRGFTQLAVETIALSMLEGAPPVIYGAVTIGSFWVFGCLDRDRHSIVQDIGGFRVPDDLEELVSILVGILAPPSAPTSPESD